MINIELKEVHVGQAIKHRIEELGLTKSEFGRLIGVPQQHINRLLERGTMETKKLCKVSQALDFNFFALFCTFPTSVNAYLATVTQPIASGMLPCWHRLRQVSIRPKDYKKIQRFCVIKLRFLKTR